MVTGIKDNLGGWILMLKAISHLRQLLKFCCMEAINEFVLFGVCLVLFFGVFWGAICLFVVLFYFGFLKFILAFLVFVLTL